MMMSQSPPPHHMISSYSKEAEAALLRAERRRRELDDGVVGQLEVGDLVCRGAHEVGVEAALDGQVRNHDAGLPLQLSLMIRGRTCGRRDVCVCVRDARRGGVLMMLQQRGWIDRRTDRPTD